MFSGKATYDGGITLPEIAEDVSDIVGIVSPFETPLLDALGNPQRAATSTHHEWLEDSLISNKSMVTNQPLYPDDDTEFQVPDHSVFRVGDLVRVVGTSEILLITGSFDNPDIISTVRGYGGTTVAEINQNQQLLIIGNGALEGGEADQARFTKRTRQGNWTQIFSRTVCVSGSDLAVRKLSIDVDDELDYQKQERLRELLRDLENTVIHGVLNSFAPEGDAGTRRTMAGILSRISSNCFVPGIDDFPAGPALDEAMLNQALRKIWENSSANIDLIVVNGSQKRRISSFIQTMQRYSPDDESYRQRVSSYESDFGVQRVVLSRWVPADSVLLLDSSRINVLPLAGRSFHYKPLASTGDFEKGVVIGEYTLEMKNEEAHGIISGLSVA